MRHLLTFVVLASFAAVLPMAAQPGPATLDGLEFPVDAKYQPVPALSDAALAVFRDPRTRLALFVATVPQGVHRTEAMARARMNAATAAMARAPGTPEWRSLPSFSISRHEVYHDARIASNGSEFVVVQLRRLRVGEREVVTGYAFPLSRQEGARVFQTSVFYEPNVPAGAASSRIVAALAGEPPAGAAPQPADDAEAAIRAAAEALAAATEARDAEAVLRLVARPYLEFLEDMHHLALHAPAERVRAEPLINQFYVLDLRHRIPAAELRMMDTRRLLAHVWDTGWLGTGGWKEGETEERRETVLVEGDLAFIRSAAGEGSRRGSPTSLALALQTAFRREDGVWKVDALTPIPLLESVLRMQVEQVSGRRDAAPLIVLQRLTDKLLESNVWNPPPPP